MADKSNGNEDLSYVSLADIIEKDIQTRPIIEQVFNEKESLLLFGAGGVGKSLTALDLALFMGSLKPEDENKPLLWDQFSVPFHRKSLFVQSENSFATTQDRIKLMCRGSPEYVFGFNCVFFPNRFNEIKVVGSLINKGFREYIINLIKGAEQNTGEKIDILVIDPLISFCDCDENDNSRMRTNLDFLTEIENIANVTSIVIHHADKRKGDIRGATAIRDWARSVIKLNPHKVGNHEAIVFTHMKNNSGKKFKTFTVYLDDCLKFNKVVKTKDAIKKLKQSKAENVIKALEEMGGAAKSQVELISKYQEMFNIGTSTTAKRHILDAIKADAVKVIKKKDKSTEYRIKVDDKNTNDKQM